MYIECNYNPTRSVLKFQGLIFQNAAHRQEISSEVQGVPKGKKKKNNEKSPLKQGRNDPASFKVNNSVKIFRSFYLISHPRKLIKNLLHGRQILFERDSLGKSPQWKLKAQKTQSPTTPSLWWDTACSSSPQNPKLKLPGEKYWKTGKLQEAR